MHAHFVPPPEVASLSQQRSIVAAQLVFSIEQASCLPKYISIASVLMKLCLLEVIFYGVTPRIVWLARPSHLIAGALRAGRDSLAAVTIGSHLIDQSDATGRNSC